MLVTRSRLGGYYERPFDCHVSRHHRHRYVELLSDELYLGQDVIGGHNYDAAAGITVRFQGLSPYRRAPSDLLQLREA